MPGTRTEKDFINVSNRNFHLPISPSVRAFKSSSKFRLLTPTSNPVERARGKETFDSFPNKQNDIPTRYISVSVNSFIPASIPSKYRANKSYLVSLNLGPALPHRLLPADLQAAVRGVHQVGLAGRAGELGEVGRGAEGDAVGGRAHVQVGGEHGLARPRARLAGVETAVRERQAC